MPFVKVWNTPSGTSGTLLNKLYQDIKNNLAETMPNVPRGWVHPLFPADKRLIAPDIEVELDPDFEHYIYVEIDTGLFHGQQNIDLLAKKITHDLTDIVWEAFGGLFSVEIFINNLNNAWKTLKKAAPTRIKFGGFDLAVKFRKATQVAPGVVCEEFDCVDKPEMDIGIIRIDPGAKTPPQKLLSGTRTVEGFLSGAGALFVTPEGGEFESFSFGMTNRIGRKFAELQPGDVVQWVAAPDSELVAIEMCWPPFSEGRFENVAS